MLKHIAFLALASLILQLCMLHMGHNFGGDFSEYIAQAIAIVDNSISTQIANNTWMMQQSDWLFGPFVYPWGYPLLLAIPYMLVGFSLFAWKLIGVLLFSLFCVMFYVFLTRFLSYRHAFITSLFFALNPMLLAFQNNILSDIPYLALSFLAVFFLSALFNANCGGGGGELAS